MMGTGHVVDTINSNHKPEDGNWVKAFFAISVDKEPGTHFQYNTGATYMLSAILQKVSGQTLLEYLESRLFIPLGIKGAVWESCPRGVNTGGFGLSLTTEDIAKFGQLYLQMGYWNNERVVAEDWIIEATSKQISTGEGDDSDWTQGYGYQFWQCRHGAYRGDGAFGQFCIVLPEQEAVIAITSGTNDTYVVMNAIWEHLLPAMVANSIPADLASAAVTAAHLLSLTIHPPQLQFTSPSEDILSGKTYKLEDASQQWDSFAILFNDSEAAITLQNKHGIHVICAGRGAWIESFARMLNDTESRMMSSFTWKAANCLQLTLQYVVTPYCFTIDVTVEDNHTIFVKQHINIYASAERLDGIIGRV